MDFQKEFKNHFFQYKILMHPECIDHLMKNEYVAPINLEINLTNLCNHNCVWCTYSYLHDGMEALEEADVVRLLQEAKEMGVKSVTWTGGGEPTVHKCFNHLIRVAAEFGFKQGLNTNGSNLNQEAIDIITKYFTYVRFSVDAADEQMHKACHQVEQFDRVIANIKAIVEKKKAINSDVTIGYSYLVDTMNYKGIYSGCLLAKNLGVDYFQIKPIVHYHQSNDQFSHESSLWKEINDGVAKSIEEETDLFRVMYLEHKFNNIQLKSEKYGRFYDICYACKVLASVGANGSVDICCAYKGIPEWSIGNIKEQTLEDIWNSKKKQEIEQKIEVKKCPIMCKGDEMNKMLNFIKNFDKQRDFI